ncbi:SAM-dependent chlorinase/fluorinase [Halorubellus sp. JP-L1]|uniref:SAM hydrolase/SAM-dependent halogenase family protein n=1 Tax=Halorubellus sp. JP-L1 TaxID=2715753 RepID=UPI00140CF2C9|nr:SAM-dependent chlorinase/fluorinase [Halorubellus sp. JP-L1]NHN42374.1 SAM-dependent chlorinase/fluorinase [Halorubellus sp. JP-L1]
MITLSSDFGSPYPAAMRGVLLRRDPDARLVDVSHEFPRQDVRAAAFWLRELLPHFPPAVHLVVVDPGVGTDRAALAVRAGEHAFVAPDNGVVVPAARALAGDDESIRAWRIDDADAASSTFHGRDVFAPAAGDLHRVGFGEFTDRSDVTRLDSFESLELPEADVTASRAVGEVMTVDDFGNVITNVPGRALEGVESVRVNDREVPAVATFAEVPVGQWLATVGSHGYVECDVNQGRGDRAFDLSSGDEVVLEVDE